MLEGSIKYKVGKIGIVVSRFNEDITANLLKGTMHGLAKYCVPENMIEVARVPGSFEIPLTAKKFLQGGCDVVIALGVIIKGETEHYEYVCKETADGIMKVQLDEGRPVIFEVLMVDDVKKAEDRSVIPIDAHGKILEESTDWLKNKGYIAALNALEMLDLYGKMECGNS